MYACRQNTKFRWASCSQWNQDIAARLFNQQVGHTDFYSARMRLEQLKLCQFFSKAFLWAKHEGNQQLLMVIAQKACEKLLKYSQYYAAAQPYVDREYFIQSFMLREMLGCFPLAGAWTYSRERHPWPCIFTSPWMAFSRIYIRKIFRWSGWRISPYIHMLTQQR